MADEQESVLWHQSGVNRQGEPFVQLIRNEAVIAQMSPAQARDHASAILQTAEAAEQDAFLITWARQKLDLSLEQAFALLQEYRAYRVEQTGKQSGALNPRDWVMPAPNCKFYGHQAIPEMRVLAHSGGNQCALILDSFAPCRMQVYEGRQPCLAECDLAKKNRGLIADLDQYRRVHLGGTAEPAK